MRSGDNEEDKMHWRIKRAEQDIEKLKEDYCLLKGRVKEVEMEEVKTSADLQNLIKLVKTMSDRIEDPLERYEKAKITVVVGIIGVVIGMILNGG